MDENEEPQEISDAERIQFLIDNLESIMGEDGGVYIHAGHLVELYNVGVELIHSIPQAAEVAGMDADDPRVIAHISGIETIIEIVYTMINGLSAKHANEVEVPIDEVLDSIGDFLKEGDK